VVSFHQHLEQYMAERRSYTGASVYDGPLFCGFDVAINGLKCAMYFTVEMQYMCINEVHGH